MSVGDRFRVRVSVGDRFRVRVSVGDRFRVRVSLGDRFRVVVRLRVRVNVSLFHHCFNESVKSISGKDQMLICQMEFVLTDY